MQVNKKLTISAAIAAAVILAVLLIVMYHPTEVPEPIQAAVAPARSVTEPPVAAVTETASPVAVMPWEAAVVSEDTTGPSETAEDIERAIAEVADQHTPLFRATPVGAQLEAHLELTEAIGPNAAARYDESLQALRRNPEEATALLDEAYQLLDEGRYLNRWKVVDTLASLEDAVALDPLVHIAGTPTPEERYPGVPELSSRDEEAMIRAAAIDGIKRLAETGSAPAESALVSLAANEDPAVRLAAVVAYRSLPRVDDRRDAALRPVLPPEDQWMLELEIAGAPPASAYLQDSDAGAPAESAGDAAADQATGTADPPPLADPASDRDATVDVISQP